MNKKHDLIRLSNLVDNHNESRCTEKHCEVCKEIEILRNSLFIEGKYFLNDMQNGNTIKFDKREAMADFLGVKGYMINNMLVLGRAAMGYTADYVIRV